MLKKLTNANTRQTSHRVVLALIAFAIGLCFIFLTPAWWHHDEPGHFQTAWYFANYGTFPYHRATDDQMRVELAKSLEDANYYAFRNYKLDLDAETPPWIREPAGRPRFSYLLYAAPLYFARSLPLAHQLTLVRGLSLIYFILTTLLIYQFSLEFFPKRGPTIGFFAAFFFALLPGAVNQMTALSKEPLAVLLFTSFLLFSHRAIKGQPVRRWLPQFLIISALLAFTIDTLWIALPVLLAAVLILRPIDLLAMRKVLMVGVPIILILLSVILFKGDEARFYFSETDDPQPARALVTLDGTQRYALQLDPNTTLVQRIPSFNNDLLSGKTATIGFYAWASQPTVIRLDHLVNFTYGAIPATTVELTQQPAWVSARVSMDEKIGNIKLRFSYPHQTWSPNDPTYYIQGMVFTPGDHSTELPAFTDSTTVNGTWDGVAINNLIRNADLTQTWLRFSPDMFYKLKFIPIPFNQSLLATIQDPASSGWYFQRALGSLEATYWGKIGASNFALLGAPWIYTFFTTLFIGCAILDLLIIKNPHRTKLNPKMAIIFTIALLIVWGQTLLRGAAELENSQIVIPWSRYAIPTFPIISILIATGFVNILGSLSDHTRRKALATTFVISLPITLVVVSIVTLISVFWLDNLLPRSLTYPAIFVCVGLTVLLSIPKVNHLTRQMLGMDE